METMKVETIGKEIIKPSSPTPNNLRTLQLSIYDHILPPVYTVAFLFYTKNDLISREHTSHKLKTSLSETLTKFYPLSGRINGVTIDCNDEGAIFVDARVNNCMAIGICISHKIADATSISTFIQSWAAMARGEAGDEVAGPEFAAANFYPPANEAFKFPVDELAEAVDRPTRVESVTALLWKGFVAAASSTTTTCDLKVLIQPVNLRSKIPSLLSQSLVGNVMFSSVVLSVGQQGEVKIEEAMSYETHEPYTVSSWCKLPLYEASFGWGSSVWVTGNIAPAFGNLAMLVDSKDKKGIEAFVTLPEENMLSFEQNPELLAFASLNPSVLV
ncbi:unnamed protein product [Arabidopsis arenosa]|uniref:Uncharacterized protein n=1 Tax=Arabidopsis arenosa TaxID=38785 RepID=A0A8S2B3H8_ARAAE|nr:unnamed protein product [Arabidopsis arenosa]